MPRRERSWRRQRLRPRAPPKILTVMHLKFFSFIKPGGDAVVEIRFWSLWGSKADPNMSCVNKNPIFSTKPAAISTGRARSKAKGSARLCSLQKTLVNHVVIAGGPFPRYEEARAKPISRCTQQPRVFSYPSRFPLSVNAFCRCCCSAQDSSWRWSRLFGGSPRRQPSNDFAASPTTEALALLKKTINCRRTPKVVS